MIEHTTPEPSQHPRIMSVGGDFLKPPLVEKNREREAQFETCVKTFKEVYSTILNVNELLTEQNDFVQQTFLEILQQFTIFIQAHNKLMVAYVKKSPDFSQRLETYNEEKVKFISLAEKDFDHNFSFSRNFAEEAQISQYMRLMKNLVAGVSAIHSYGNDLFAYTIQSESLQIMKDKFLKVSSQPPTEVEGTQNLLERIQVLSSNIKRLKNRLVPSAELIISDLKEGYFTEQTLVSKFVTTFGRYSLELFRQSYEEGENILLLPNNADTFGSIHANIMYLCNFSEGLLKQWVKDSLENSYKAFRAHVDSQKPSARFKSVTVKNAANSMSNHLQDSDQFADNRPYPESFKIQLDVSTESEAGVDYVVFSIIDNGMGIVGERKKFESGQGGYDGKQHSSGVGMAMLAKSVSQYSSEIELRKRTDEKRGVVSILRIPIETQQVLPKKEDDSLSSVSIAS